MANPNNLSPKVETQVIILTGQASAAGFTAPDFVSEFAASPSFPTRIKSYTGTAREKDALLEADGFAVTDPARLQVAAAMAQDGPPLVIWVGRRDAGDATWGDTMDAIDAENSSDWYALCIDARDSVAIQQVHAWVNPPGQPAKFAYFNSQTDSAQVRDDAPGNFASVISALGDQRTSLLYHDPATASGLGPASTTSRTGPFAFGASASLSFRFDGGVTQPYTFSAAAASLLGSIVETYDLSAGGDLVLASNGLASQTITFADTSATVISGQVEPYSLAPSDTLLVRVDGGVAQVATIAAAAAVDLGSATEPLAPGVGDNFDIKINGGGLQSFVFDGTETTAQLVADLINATATGVVASDNAGAVELTTDRFGTSASIEVVVSSTPALLVVLGFLVGTVAGSGDVADVSATTAAEIAAVVTTDITGASAVDEGGAVRITAASIGTASRVQVTGGNIQTILIFPTAEASGTGDFADATAASAAEVVGAINAGIGGMVAAVDTTAVRLTSTVLGTSSAITVTAGAVAALLGLAAGTVIGTGDFANAAQATASEIATAIQVAGIVGGTAIAVSSAVVLSSATSGITSTVEVLTDTVGLGWSGDGFATGTGVSEDYADCAWVGRCITFNLDGQNGAALWDNQELNGISPDVLTLAQRTSLDQRRVNFYVSLDGVRAETHWGYILRDDILYIDELTSADWLDARMTEDINNLLNNYTNNKAKIPYLESFTLIGNVFRNRLKISDRDGHTTYDGSNLDLTSDTDTGVYIPTFADQSQADIDARRVTGFRARQSYKSGAQRVNNLIEVQRPPVQL